MTNRFADTFTDNNDNYTFAFRWCEVCQATVIGAWSELESRWVHSDTIDVNGSVVETGTHAVDGSGFVGH